MLDLNEIGKDLPHCDLGSLSVSPDNQLLAYSIDASGDEKYDLCFRDLKTGKQVLTNHTAVVSEVTFGKTNDVLYYTTMDDVHRTDKVRQAFHHRDGEPD
jgi:oligopeptidase B